MEEENQTPGIQYIVTEIHDDTTEHENIAIDDATHVVLYLGAPIIMRKRRVVIDMVDIDRTPTSTTKSDSYNNHWNYPDSGDFDTID